MRQLLLGALLFLLGWQCAYATPIGIYWTERYGGIVGYAALDGSNPTTLVSGLASPGGGMTVTDDAIYWTDQATNAIWKSNSNGSAAGALELTAGTPRDVAVTSQNIFWVSTGALDSVSKSNLDGTGATTLVTSDLSFPTGISLFDGMLYWSDSGTTSIKRSGTDGSGVTTILSGLPVTQLPTDLFLTEQFIYWATRDLALTQGGATAPGTIQRANRDGTNMTTLVTDLIFPQNLFVTNDYVYWADMYAGKIQRADLTGSGTTDLIVGLDNPVGIAVVTGSAPEPASLALLGLGLAGIGYQRRKRAA